MALIVKTAQPEQLVAKIRAAIDARHIDTWVYDADGDFTHAPLQWRNRAWLRPQTAGGELRFGLVGQTGIAMSREIYAVFHGRFIEMLLAHFDHDFENVLTTALKSKPDQFSA